MVLERSVDRIQEHVVSDIANQLAGLVQVREKSRSRLLNQITDDFVVEIIDLNPSPIEKSVECQRVERNVRVPR